MSFKKILIKAGILEKEIIKAGEESLQFLIEASRHYCKPCDRWFEEYRGLASHNRFKHPNA